MNWKKWTALILFAAALILNLTGNYIDNELMCRVSKPLLMPLLLLNALVFLEGTMAPKWLGTLLCLALGFHCAGDVFLMLAGPFVFFVAGLASFLVGHLFYISIFVRKGILVGGNRNKIALLGTVLPVIVACVVLLVKMEGPIRYAVLVYGTVLLMISALGLCGICNKASGVSGKVYWLTFVGGLIFLFSDFLVAWRSLLGNDFPHMGFVIMFTYVLAECLIVASIVIPYTGVKAK